MTDELITARRDPFADRLCGANEVVNLCFQLPLIGDLMPANYAGAVLRRAHWESIKARVGRFYETVSDEEIERYNSALATSERRPAARAETGGRSRAGVVYLLRGEHGYFKIGRTTDLELRARVFGLTLPFAVELVHSVDVPDAVWAERFLHERFASKRVRGEWFTLAPEDVEWICALTALSREDREDIEL